MNMQCFLQCDATRWILTSEPSGQINEAVCAFYATRENYSASIIDKAIKLQARLFVTASSGESQQCSCSVVSGNDSFLAWSRRS